MPFNDPAVYRPSNLTRKQQQEQLAACYGVKEMSMELTATEAEQMRGLLAKYDSQHKKIEIHNINEQPRVPYRHQKFPMMMYNHEKSYPAHTETKTAIVGSSVLEETIHIKAKVSTRIVHSEHEMESAKVEGWSTTPPEFREEPEETMSDEIRKEMESVVKRGPGRPPKAVA